MATCGHGTRLGALVKRQLAWSSRQRPSLSDRRAAWHDSEVEVMTRSYINWPLLGRGAACCSTGTKGDRFVVVNSVPISA